ncbi:MAG: hypothetical protein H7X84_11705 [Verrucomicrobia bacterium]|nr:hypothetical protein [Prolixibacteraceae bacterium]
MKRIVIMLLCAGILSACSAPSRMNKKNDAGDILKRIILVQSLHVQAQEAKTDSLLPSAESLSAVYLYEEKTNARPQITLTLRSVKESHDAEIDSNLVIILDKEEIKLHVKPYINSPSQKESVSPADLHPTYSIPENLWISMVHSKELYYRISKGEQAIALVLKQSEKEELDEFLKMAIKHRDARFPAIPEGQVKW